MSRPSQIHTANNRPNLFGYATKEMAQDAMICWLIAWADSRAPAGPEDEPLRLLGRVFVEALFATWEDYPVELGEEVCTEIHAQKHNIDVLVRVNCRHVLLIEDKTGTNVHGGQLGRYWKRVVEGKTVLGRVGEEDVYPVFLKTGNFSLRDRESVEEQGYAVFDRSDFLQVLHSYRGSSDILLDFRRHLARWQAETESFRAWTEDGARTDRGWQGLYALIEARHLLKGPDNWGAITHLVGGFEGLWLEPDEKSRNSRFAIWVEKDRISFRLYRSKTKPCKAGMKREQEYWADAFVRHGEGKFSRPPKSRYFPTKTKPMCVSEWRGWLRFGDGRLDLDASMASVPKAREILVAAIKRAARDGH